MNLARCPWRIIIENAKHGFTIINGTTYEMNVLKYVWYIHGWDIEHEIY